MGARTHKNLFQNGLSKLHPMQKQMPGTSSTSQIPQIDSMSNVLNLACPRIASGNIPFNKTNSSLGMQKQPKHDRNLPDFGGNVPNVQSFEGQPSFLSNNILSSQNSIGSDKNKFYQQQKRYTMLTEAELLKNKCIYWTDLTNYIYYYPDRDKLIYPV